ncbi:MAG: Clp protease ClpP [Bacteroides sp.]|nr:Clp protease ClpP [Bacteroides sp.]MCM1391024.1 Clp protease ClpP [Bacteroides sp.]
MDYQLVLDYSIGVWGYSKQYVRSILAKHKGKPVNVNISSLGGDLDHGLDIRQQFIDHGDVTVYITGMTASAATVIAMGAKKICMSRYAAIMIHKCSNYIDEWGYYNADEMQALIDKLTKNKRENDKIDITLAQLYADRSGHKVSELMDVLKAGEWITAEDALALGLIDEITEGGKADAPVVDEAMERKLNALGLGTSGLEAFRPAPSIWTSIKTSFWSKKGSAETADETPDDIDDSASGSETDGDDESTNNNSTMKKIALSEPISAALGRNEVEADDNGDITVNEGDITKIDAHIGALNNSIAEKDAEIARLNEQVNALKAQPADTTDETPEDLGEDRPTANDLYKSIQNFL